MLNRLKFLLLVVCLASSFIGLAGDLDDGIGLDEDINDDLTLTPNKTYLMMQARSKLKNQSALDSTLIFCEGDSAKVSTPYGKFKGEITYLPASSRVCKERKQREKQELKRLREGSKEGNE